MKKILAKTLMACAVTAAVGFGSSAMAQTSTQLFAPFTINPSILDNNGIAPFTSNLINGGYNEQLTVSADGTKFNVSLYWNAGQYGTNNANGTTTYSPQGLGSSYGLYVLYTGQGTISGGTLSFTPGGSLSAWLDRNNDSSFNLTGVGGAPISVGANGDDVLLATGAPLSGTGVLTDCTAPQIGCGFFRGSTSFNTTGTLNGIQAQGSSFFTAPNPFYSLSFQTGQFDNLNVAPGATSNVKGSLDVTFANAAAVPEPGSVALVGLGMVAVYLSRRRKQA